MRATFGPFRFDLETLELTRSGIRLRLEEKPARLLACLIERRGSLVSREELRQRLWEDGLNLNFEHGLNKAINKLRATLGEDATNPKYVETVSRRGYRFIHPVELLPQADMELIKVASLRDIPTPATWVNQTAGDSDQPPHPAPQVRPVQDQRLGRLSLLAIGAALVALIPALGMLGHMPRLRPTAPQHLKLPARLRLINAENGIGITLSPDGSRAAFSVAGADGRTRLCLYDLKSSRAQELPGTEGGQSPFWEPNGNRLGFFTVEELKTIDLANYSIKVLATVASPRGGSWSAKGVILFASGTRGPIFRIPAEGGTPAVATMLDANTHATTHRWPSFLPDGNRFIFLEADHDLPEMPGKIMLGSLDGGPPRFLLESDSNAVPAADSLAFVSHGKLLSVHLDLQTLQTDAQAKILAEKIECAPGSWYCAFDLNRGGAVYRLENSAANKQTIAWFDLAGNRIADYGRPGLYRSVDVSPDGKTVAVICGNPDEKVCLFHADGTVTALDSAGTTSVSVWAPDSSAIAYMDHLSDSEFILRIKPVTHAAPAQAVLISKSDTVPVAWHPSGRYLLLSQSDPVDRHFSIRVLDLKTGETMPYMETDSPVGVTAEFSPDGRWLAYSKESEGIPEILVASFPVPTTVFPLTSDGGCAPKWRADGRGIFYLGRGDTIHYVPIVVQSRNFRLGMSAALFQPPIFSAPWNCTSFDISRDGHHFLVNTTGQSEKQELVYRPN